MEPTTPPHRTRNRRPGRADSRVHSGLAEYEKLGHKVVADEEKLRASLFGPRSYAEVIFGYEGDTPAAFALFFHNYSTFRGSPGIYLEDLFVKPEFRGKGYGKANAVAVAKLAVERAASGWNGPPGLERAGYRLLQAPRGGPDGDGSLPAGG